MAGLLIAFITEYIGSRIVQWTSKKNTRQDQPIPAVEESGSTSSNEKVSNEDDPLAKLQVVVMEAGIIFHSIRTSFPFDHIVPTLTGGLSDRLDFGCG